MLMATAAGSALRDTAFPDAGAPFDEDLEASVRRYRDEGDQGWQAKKEDVAELFRRPEGREGLFGEGKQVLCSLGRRTIEATQAWPCPGQVINSNHPLHCKLQASPSLMIPMLLFSLSEILPASRIAVDTIVE